INEENATAHTWWKALDYLHRSGRLRFAFGAANGGARGTFRKCFWRANKSSQCARGHDGGRTQIHLRIAITHPALEISIGGADRDFAFAHETPPQANACSATGWQRNGARIQQSLPITSGLGLRLHLGTRRGEIKFDARSNVSTAGAHHFGGVMQIFEARVYAR